MVANNRKNQSWRFEKKEHYRAYKTGRGWVSVMVVGFGVTAAMIGGTRVLAAEGTSQGHVASAEQVAQPESTQTFALKDAGVAEFKNTSTANNQTDAKIVTAEGVANQNVVGFRQTATQNTQPVSEQPDPQHIESAAEQTTPQPVTPEAKVSQPAESVPTPAAVHSATELTAAKTAAAGEYAKTGQPQKVTAVLTIATGVNGTAHYEIDDSGAMTIHAGTLGGSDWGDKNAVTSLTADQGVIVAGEAGNELFANMPNLKTADLHNVDTSRATSLRGTFSNDTALQTINVDGWDTSKVTNMSWLLYKDPVLESADLSSWDTGNVTTMANMFAEDVGVKSIDVSKFDTGKVTDFSNMFAGTQSLKALDVSKFDTGKVTDFSGMFSENHSLESLDVSGFDTSSATNMSSMFAGTQSLKTLDVSKFDTGKVTDFSGMFSENKALGSLDVSGFDTSSATNMFDMFRGAQLLQTLDVANFNTGNVTNFGNMFTWMNVTALDVSHFDTHSATNMAGMFMNTFALKHLDVSHFDTSKVTSMASMFGGAQSLQDLDVSNMDMTHADVDSMFIFTYKLWKLTVGPKTKLVGTKLDHAPGKDTPLPDGSGSLNKTTLWQAVEDGTPHEPHGLSVATDVMFAHYTGSHGKKETYVWSQYVVNDARLFDAATGIELKSALYPHITGFGPYGVGINTGRDTVFTKYFPTGWTYALGADLNGHQQPGNNTAAGAMTPLGTAGTTFDFYLVNTKSAVVRQIPLTIQYVTDNGTPLQLPVTIRGDAGDSFSVEAPIISGYHLVEPSKQASAGVYHGDKMVLTLNYAKDAQPANDVVNPPTDAGGTTPPDANNTVPPTNLNTVPADDVPMPELPATFGEPGQMPQSKDGPVGAPHRQLADTFGKSAKSRNIVQAGTAGNAQQKQISLPQTGDGLESTMAIIGIALAGFMGLLGFEIKHRRVGDD